VRFVRLAGIPCALLTLALFAPPARSQQPAPGGGIHYIYLIRHGDYTRDRSTDEVSGNGLNALGHEQAKLLGARLAALPVKPASLVTSNYKRARETADDIGQALGMTPTVDSLLHECNFTSDRPDYMRNDTRAEIAACDSNFAHAWAKYMVPTPQRDRHDVLVCHGNVIRTFVSRLVCGDSRHWPTMEIGNGSLTVLAVRADGRMKLVCFSDVGHLPVAQQTWTGHGAGWGTPAPR